MFEVNGNYANRKGHYTVLSIGPEKMKVRYEDGTEAELKISVQERIWENIRTEVEAATASRAKRKAGSNNQHFIKTIMAISDGDLNPAAIRALVTPSSPKAPTINIGDRFIYYAIEAKSFFAVGTITAEAKEAKAKDFAELQFEGKTILVYPIDLDAYATTMAQAVWLDSVELESQPDFRKMLNKPETYLSISEDDFELLAELLTEFVEEDIDEDDDLDEDDDDLDLDDDLDM